MLPQPREPVQQSCRDYSDELRELENPRAARLRLRSKGGRIRNLQAGRWCSTAAPYLILLRSRLCTSARGSCEVAAVTACGEVPLGAAP